MLWRDYVVLCCVCGWFGDAFVCVDAVQFVVCGFVSLAATLKYHVPCRAQGDDDHLLMSLNVLRVIKLPHVPLPLPHSADPLWSGGLEASRGSEAWVKRLGGFGQEARRLWSGGLEALAKRLGGFGQEAWRLGSSGLEAWVKRLGGFGQEARRLWS